MFLEYIMAWNFAAVVCLLVGLGLLIFEMFTPGLGVPALFGVLALIAAIVLSARSFASALITLALILIILSVCAFFIIRSMRKGRLSNSWLVLKEAVDGSSFAQEDKGSLVGLEGVCLSTLRPAGSADFDGRRLDVMSEGDFIPKGSRIRIQRVEGFKIIVKKIED